MRYDLLAQQFREIVYFRQVLGRILRANGTVGEEGYFYMPAEPTLVEYAHRLAEDIPSTNVVKFETMQRPARQRPGTIRR